MQKQKHSKTLKNTQKNILKKTVKFPKMSYLKLLQEAKQILLVDIDKGMQILHSALEEANKKEDWKNKADISIELSEAYLLKGQLSTCLELLQSTQEIYNNINDIFGTYKCLYLLGKCYLLVKDYDRAMLIYLKALSQLKKINNLKEFAIYRINNLKEFANCKLQMGIIYFNLQSYKHALAIFKEALSVYEEVTFKQGVIEVCYWIGETCFRLENYTDTQTYLQNAIVLSGFSKNLTIFKTYIIYCLTHIELDNLNRAEVYITKAIEIFEELQLHSSKLLLLKAQAKLKLAHNNYEEAEKLLEEALLLAKEQNLDEENEFLILYSRCFEMKGDYKNALHYANEHNKITQIFNQEFSNLRLKNAHLLYDLEKAQKEVEEHLGIINDKNKLIIDISNYLRNQLNDLIGITNLLSNSSLNEQQNEFLNLIQNTNYELLNATNNIYTVINTIPNKKQITEFSLVNELKKIQQYFAPIAINKKLLFNLYIDPQIPELLLGNMFAFHQTIYNLLLNSFNYVQAGFIQCNLNIIEIKNTEVFIKVEVIDSGVGMNNFFEYQKTTNKVYKPTLGLGLVAIKKNIADNNQKIAVNSEVNKGTTISFDWMFTLAKTANKPKTNKKGANKPQKNININGTLCLIVINNPSNATFIKKIIENSGGVVQKADNIESILNSIQSNAFDVVITDIEQTHFDGFYLTQCIRQHPNKTIKHIPIIGLSSKLEYAFYEKAISIGMNEFLVKPIDQIELIETIKRLLPQTFDKIKPKAVQSNGSSTVPYLAHLHKKMNGNVENMIAMVEVLLHQIPNTLIEMEKAIADENWLKLQFEAHKINSTISIVGVDELTDVIKTFDQYSFNRQNLQEIPDLLRKFKIQAKKIEEKLYREMMLLKAK